MLSASTASPPRTDRAPAPVVIGSTRPILPLGCTVPLSNPEQLLILGALLILVLTVVWTITQID